MASKNKKIRCRIESCQEEMVSQNYQRHLERCHPSENSKDRRVFGQHKLTFSFSTQRSGCREGEEQGGDEKQGGGKEHGGDEDQGADKELLLASEVVDENDNVSTEKTEKDKDNAEIEEANVQKSSKRA